jgi:hypothetical protein
MDYLFTIFYGALIMEPIGMTYQKLLLLVNQRNSRMDCRFNNNGLPSGKG